MLFWFIIITLSTILIIAYHSHIKLNISIRGTNKSHNISMNISAFFGIINYNLETTILDFINNISKSKDNLTKKEKETQAKDFDGFIGILKNFKMQYGRQRKTINYIVKKLNIYDMSLSIKFGLNDAYETGIIYGLANLIIINTLAWIKRKVNLKVKNICIQPFLNKNIYDMEFNCIITIKLGNIITALKMFTNTSRGSDIDGTTHRKTDENNHGKHKRND